MQVRLSGSVRPSVMPQAAVHLRLTFRDLVAEGRPDGQGWHISTSQTWSVETLELFAYILVGGSAHSGLFKGYWSSFLPLVLRA